MEVLINAEACQGSSTLINVSYPSGAENFSIVSPVTGISINATNGRVSIANTLTLGWYSIIVLYEIPGETVTQYEAIVNVWVKDCAKDLDKTVFEFCNGETAILTLSSAGTIGTPDFVSVSIGYTLIETNKYELDLSGIALNDLVAVSVTVDGENKEFSVRKIDCNANNQISLTDCPNDPLQVVWKNRAGGWNNFWLMQDKGYAVDQSGGKSYINVNDEKRWTSRGDIYDVVEINNQLVPKTHVDLVRSLRDSIQAYIATDIEDPETFVPIIIDEQGFSLYATGDEFYSFSFRFKYAKKRKVQQQ